MTVQVASDGPVDIAYMEAYVRSVAEKYALARRPRLELVGATSSVADAASDDWEGILASLGYIREACLLAPGPSPPAGPRPEFLQKNWRSALGVLQYHRCWRAACRLLREAIASDVTESR